MEQKIPSPSESRPVAPANSSPKKEYARPELRTLGSSIGEALKNADAGDAGGSLRSVLERLARNMEPSERRKSLMSDYTAEQLAALRNKDKVGPDKYGEGLVNKHHKGAKTLEEHEQAQKKAYAELQEKIDAGVVDPRGIGADILRELHVTADVGEPLTRYEEIHGRITSELQGFLKEGFIDQQELQDVSHEMQKFLVDYRAAYPDKDVMTAYELTRDNARKLAYQIKRDKYMFSGSDHGNLHLLRGNMKFAEQIAEDMEALGRPIDAKTMVLIRQNMYDHDLGYASGAAQAPYGFEASKDHPLFSTRFIEENREYYVEKLGQKEYEALVEIVLQHSYPQTKFDYEPRAGEDFNFDLARSITSTVDSLGTTAETKMPAFFRQPEAVRTLLKIRLAMETSGVANKKGLKVVEPRLMEQYKQELRAIAEKADNADRRAGYLNSVDNFFNEFTAEATLGQFAGVVDRVGVVKAEDGRLIPKVNMRMSEAHAFIGDMFGGKVEVQAHKKGMEDLGVGEEERVSFGKTIERARREGKPLTEPLILKTGRAIFEVAPHAADGDAGERVAHAVDESGKREAVPMGEIAGIMKEVKTLSIRSEINSLLDALDSSTGESEATRAVQVLEIQQRFIAGVSEKTTAQEITHIRQLLDAVRANNSVQLTKEQLTGIMSHIPSDAVRQAEFTDLTAFLSDDSAAGERAVTSSEAGKLLSRYITQSEREFLEL